MIATALIGIAAGVVSGLFGIGGGILFVPALVLVAGLGQVDAEATSLLAMIPVALVGAARQYHYGNLRIADGITAGLVAVVGTAGGVAAANALPERALEIGFAFLMLFIAFRMAKRGWEGRRESRA
jgi:uncharacterized membrane protein YfcA